jgi:Zn-dependent peptidase ImmA (M78 family)
MQNSIIREILNLKNRFGTSDPFEIIVGLKINLWFKSDLGNLKGFYLAALHQRYIVINENLDERNQLIVAAHELGHDRMHQDIAQVSPLKDFKLFDMTSRVEYQANIFASELLIADDEVEECIAEDMDFFGLSCMLGFNPQLVAFKLFGMMQRGYTINLPKYWMVHF